MTPTNTRNDSRRFFFSKGNTKMRVHSIIVMVASLAVLTHQARAVPTASEGFLVDLYATIDEPVGIGADRYGNLYVGNDPATGDPNDHTEAARIRKVSIGGSPVAEIGLIITDPDTVIVDTAGSVVGAGNVIISGARRLFEVNPVTGATSVAYTPSTNHNLAEMAFDSTGRLFVGTLGEAVLMVDSGTVSIFATFPGHWAASVAFDDDDMLYVGLRDNGQILKLDLSTPTSPTVLATVPSFVRDIAFTSRGPLGGRLMAAAEDGSVYAIEPLTGDVTELASGFGIADSLAYSPTGELYVSAGDIYRISHPDWPIAGDANLDGTANALDLSVLASHWDQIDNVWTEGDLTGDGRVNGLDLSVLATNWLSSVAGKEIGLDEGVISSGLLVIPEPASAALLVAGCFLLLRRRHVQM